MKPVTGDSSGDRILAVLRLFSLERPMWTVEEAAAELSVSVTTAYRYFKSLSRIGLIYPISRASYTLGPAIIELDRQIQISDPMLNAARGVMRDLIGYAAERSFILLCRSFRDRVLCVHQVVGRGPQAPISYERGRPMPLFRGATSKIILAHLPPRALKKLFAEHRKEIAAAGLGRDWESFRDALAAMRRAGSLVTAGEVDRGRAGIAAPIFDQDRAILGSLSLVLPAEIATDAAIARLTPLVVGGAREIEQAMAGRQAPVQTKKRRAR